MENFRRLNPINHDFSSWHRQPAGGEWRDLNFDDGNSQDYFTDEQYIVYNGKILQNALGEPPVDAKTFKQGRVDFGFAYDRYSTYSRGKRAGDAPPVHPIDATSLVAMPEEQYFLIDKTFIHDKNNLFSTGGVYLGSARGLEKIASSTGSMTSCGDYYSLIYRTEAFILFNDVILDADQASFQIVQWDGDQILNYRDKNGTKRFPVLKDATQDKTTETAATTSKQPYWAVSDARYCAEGVKNSLSKEDKRFGGLTFICKTPSTGKHTRILLAGGLAGLLGVGLLIWLKRRSRWI